MPSANMRGLWSGKGSVVSLRVCVRVRAAQASTVRNFRFFSDVVELILDRKLKTRNESAFGSSAS